jgi:putative spermidine/putrescine transport system substrate-binding protein
MVELRPSRRQVLRWGLGGAALLASTGFSGCQNPRLRLATSRGEMPRAWTSRLPSPWQLQPLEGGAAAVRQALRGPQAARPDLLQLGDGWATSLDPAGLQPLGTDALLARLLPQAAPVARLFAPEGSPLLAFPWSLNPWVLVLRNRPDLARRRAEGWDLLLDPSLAGSLVLPSSPRVCIALLGEDPERLARLRRQAIAFDDRDGLSLVLAGDAEAAVVPRQRVAPLLQRDPRLAVVLPEQGAPLGWSLLVSPAGAATPPLDWLAAVLEPPVLPRLLAAGWVPPLAAAGMEQELARLPRPLRTLLAPPPAVLARCRSLPPLDPAERRRLQALWEGAAPPEPG